MSTSVTEVIILSLQPGTDVDVTMKNSHNILSRQPGFKSMQWGLWIEDSSKLQALLEWEDISFHKAFETRGEDFAALMGHLRSVMTGAPDMHHVKFLKM